MILTQRLHCTDRLCSFCASNEEFLVCITLPIYEEKREFGEEAIVDFTEG